MTKTIKLALAATALLGSTAAFAGAKSEEKSFKHNGYTYVYQVEQTAHARHITGRYYPGGQTFALDVRKDRVEGTVGSSDVRFNLKDVVHVGGDALASAD